MVTLATISGVEIVKVTARTGDVFTIERAQEGTSAQSFDAGAKVQMRITAGHFEDLRDVGLRYDNIPTDVVPGLNADKINGAQMTDFYLNSSDLNVFDPRVIDFGAGYRENIKLQTNIAAVDLNWDKNVLLIPFDGANNSTVFTDRSINPKTITRYGDAKISTDQSKFGVSSGYFDGYSDFLEIADSNDFTFGNGDFTIEGWVYFTGWPKLSSGAYFSTLVAKDAPGGREFWVRAIGTASSITGIQLAITPDGTNFAAALGSTSLSLNTWYHLAATRYGNTLNVFSNGVLLVTTSAQNYTIPNTSTTLRIGVDGYNSAWIDRIS